MNLGSINNAKVSFDISRHPNTEMNCLGITISSRIDTDFVCKTIINGITPDDIDRLCRELQFLKAQLKFREGKKN